MAATTTTTTFRRTPTINLNPPPVHHKPISKLSSLSFQHTTKKHHSWSTPLISFSTSRNFSRPHFTFISCSADDTVVTDEPNDVVSDDPIPQAEDTTDDDDTVKDDGSGLEEVPVTVSSSLQSYKEALAENDEIKVSEIEAYLKSVEDEKLVVEGKLAALSDELSSAKDRVLRISADFDNFRKRTERERVSLVANAQGEVVENLLPVLDNFERAKAAIKVENESEEKINNSYQSIYKQFVEILNSLGVVPVETTGQPFDPLLHEAIMREDSSEFEEGVVIQEFRKGFRIGERLLRPSMVKVSAGPGPENAESASPSEPEAEAPGPDTFVEAEIVVDQTEASPAQDE